MTHYIDSIATFCSVYKNKILNQTHVYKKTEGGQSYIIHCSGGDAMAKLADVKESFVGDVIYYKNRFKLERLA